MSEITSAKPVICDRCGEAIDFRCFPAAIHVVGEKHFHIGCVTSKPDLRDDRIAELEKLKAVVAEYLAERDAPVPDYALRRVLVDRLRTTLEASEKK